MYAVDEGAWNHAYGPRCMRRTRPSKSKNHVSLTHWVLRLWPRRLFQAPRPPLAWWTRRQISNPKIAGSSPAGGDLAGGMPFLRVCEYASASSCALTRVRIRDICARRTRSARARSAGGSVWKLDRIRIGTPPTAETHWRGVCHPASCRANDLGRVKWALPFQATVVQKVVWGKVEPSPLQASCWLACPPPAAAAVCQTQ